MKRMVIAALTLAMGVVAGAAQAEADQHTSDATKEAIKTLWQTQHKALDAHDVDGVLATYAESDDIMLMGTGPGEHWVGTEQVKDAYTHFMENFDANTAEVKCGETAASSQGDVIWLTGVCDFSDKKGDQPRQYVMNLSAVLVKQGDTWRFHTMHFSHLLNGDDAEPQEASK